MTQTTHNTQDTTQDTQPTPATPETISIETLREDIAVHHKEALYELEHGMFYTAKYGIEICIALSKQIYDIQCKE